MQGPVAVALVAVVLPPEPALVRVMALEPEVAPAGAPPVDVPVGDDAPAVPILPAPAALVAVAPVAPLPEVLGPTALPVPAALTMFISVEVGPPSLPASLQNPPTFS
jgi:hypothetical protein